MILRCDHLEQLNKITMPYLLSTNKLTNDIVEYAKDCIVIELSVLKGEIPYSDSGIQDFIGTVDQSNIESEIQSRISDMVNKLTQKIPNCKISLQSCTMKMSTVEVIIKINDIEVGYNLKRNYTDPSSANSI